MSLTACYNPSTQGGGPRRQDAGMLLGAVGGALAGSQFGKGSGQLVGVAIGTLAGTAIGGAIGESMDDVDRIKHNQALVQSLNYAPSGQHNEWRNPDSGHYGSIKPERTYQMHGRYCREFTQTIYVGHDRQEAFGTACRNPDGSWEIVNTKAAH